MNDISKIKKNLIKRKKSNLKEEALNLSKRKSLYKGVMVVMTIYALFMGFAIYAKKDTNATYFNSIFKTNINFNEFNERINNLLDLHIISDSIKDEDLTVSGSVNYIELGDDYYISDGSLATSIDSGIVSYVNGKDDNYTVIINYDNGVMATYYDLVEVNVFNNDRVYMGDILGSYNEKVKIVFIRNDEKITYEDVISSN
jgi:hypothetical protein